MRVLLTTILFFSLGLCYSQTIDCKSLIVQFHNNPFFSHSYADLPTLVDSIESVFIKLPPDKKEFTEPKNLVAVWFLIDSIGSTHCHFIEIGADSVKNFKAIERIKSTRFVPDEYPGSRSFQWKFGVVEIK